STLHHRAPPSSPTRRSSDLNMLFKTQLLAETCHFNRKVIFNKIQLVPQRAEVVVLPQKAPKDPRKFQNHQARLMVLKLSRILRRLLRKHDNFSPLRDELDFIEDYLSIEVARFGEKLRFEKHVEIGRASCRGRGWSAVVEGG